MKNLGTKDIELDPTAYEILWQDTDGEPITPMNAELVILRGAQHTGKVVFKKHLGDTLSFQFSRKELRKIKRRSRPFFVLPAKQLYYELLVDNAGGKPAVLLKGKVGSYKGWK